jgi:hypothetical protein
MSSWSITEALREQVRDRLVQLRDQGSAAAGRLLARWEKLARQRQRVRKSLALKRGKDRG